ncbi:MAG: AAA family ATPase [Bacteroidota bacterium]
MDLIYFLRVLFRRKWLILAIVAIAVTTTFLITYNAPKIYNAHARIATGISDQQSLLFASEGVSSSQRYEIAAKFNNMVERIRSPHVLDLVGYQLFLHDLKSDPPFRPESYRELNAAYASNELQVAAEQFLLQSDSLEALQPTNELERKHLAMLRLMRYDASSLAARLEVRRIPGTDYIGIDFHAENPQMAAFVVNTLSQEYIRYHNDFNSDRAGSAVNFYAQQLTETQNDLNQKMREWQQYQNTLGVDEPNSQNNELMDLIKLLQDKRSEATQQRFVAQRNLREANQALRQEASIWKPNQGPSRGANPQLNLRQEISRLNARYAAESSKNNRILDSISRLQTQLERFLFDEITKETPTAAESQGASFQAKIKSELAIDIAQERINIIDQNLRKVGETEAGNQLTDQAGSPLGLEVDQARDKYLLALAKYSEARLAASGSEVVSPSQVDFVYPPEQGVASKSPLLVVLAGLVSLALCIVLIFILEYLDRSVKYPSRFQETTGLPILGLLNRLDAGNLDLVGLFNQTQKSQVLETYKQLLRKIRYELVESGDQKILLTSTKEGTGKTALIISLAYSLSLNGKRVLLIDTNFKDHALTDITTASPTLEDYIKGKIKREALISNSVFERVDVIGTAASTLSPAEILDEYRFAQLLDDVSKEYDLILMEGPPLNTYSDTRELVNYADKVLPIFSATANINQRDLHSIEYLKSLDDQLLGAILNKVEINNLDQ